MTVLTELRPILIELSDLELCASLFDDAFTHYQTIYPAAQVPSSDPHVPPGSPPFQLLDILVLADLHNTLGRYEKAIEVIRRGCRWLQGRGAQKFWDALEDDREWDPPVGPNGESARVVGEGEVQPGLYPLDVNARHRLAIARIKMGDIVEGKVSASLEPSLYALIFSVQMHANILLAEDIMDGAALFGEIADAYFERGMYAEAGHIYEMLGADAGVRPFPGDVVSP